MSDFPSFPHLHPIAVVFEPGEISALHDAILIYDLMHDGCLADALALMDRSVTPENPHGDGGYGDSIHRTLTALRDKLDHADRANRNEIRKWKVRYNEWSKGLDSSADS